MKTKNHIIICILFLLISGINNKVKAFLFQRKIDSIQIIFDKNQLVLPGESFKIGVASFHKNGKIRKTININSGLVFWWRYKVEVVGGTFKAGNITVNERLMPSKGKYINVKVYPKRNPELTQQLLIPLNYETKIEFQPTTDFDKAPGSNFEGIIVSTFNNGQNRFYTRLNKNNESIPFYFETNGGAWKKGKFTIEPDFTKIENHRAALITHSLRNNEVSDTFNVVMDYKHAYHLSFKGFNGSDGFDGRNGSAGVLGYDGENGDYGQDGEPGFNGPDVGVWADLYFDSLMNNYLVYVYAENLQTGEEFKYLLNPEGGSLTVTTEGGNGGSGGDGGRGGDGSNGRDGTVWYEHKVIKRKVKEPRTRTVSKKVKKQVRDSEGNIKEIEEEVQETETYYVEVEKNEVITIERRSPGEKGGDGGNGGAGGLGGQGGDGGNIYLYFTDDCWIFQNLFSAISRGGSGGLNGNGGYGGNGGRGGIGEPNGPNGYSGRRGSSNSGWEFNGWNGRIFKDSTKEFFFYETKADALSEKLQKQTY